MKILIVEDDLRLAKSMFEALIKNHLVELAHSGEMALEIISQESFELVLLDLYLPDMTGLAICKKIRKSGLQIPILVVTGENKTTTAISLLNAGADDYITKPFSIEELRARVQAVGRRYRAYNTIPRIIQIGDITLNCGTHIATRRGQDIYLRNKEFAILEQLMLHPNAVISRGSLLDKAWDNNNKAWTNLIDVHITYLRNKIDKPFGAHSIKTIHGLGYKFTPEEL